jgi:hypothetical protein
MINILKVALVVTWLVFAMTFAAPVNSANTNSISVASIEYSRDPTTVLVSFREILPEFADQDPTPLVRIYGDGRVVIYHPAYMKQAGQYEMMMSPRELEDLLLQLTPALINFDEKEVEMQKKASDKLLLASASDWNEVTLLHDSDAEISVFQINIEAYQAEGKESQIHYGLNLERSWRGLRFDARDYLGLEPVQALMQAENALRSLTRRNELVRVD